jgi:hypothetical protein
MWRAHSCARSAGEDARRSTTLATLGVGMTTFGILDIP